MNEPQQVKIGPKYFQNEKKAYSNWRTALIRECLQNASENTINSTEIHFNITGQIIDVRDNGRGMTRETLVNVFMNMGESTKGVDDCGGFGIARNLICFAQENYSITSQDYIVHGQGASYTVLGNKEWVKGCAFTIDMGEDRSEFMMNSLNTILNRSSIRQRIFINGQEFVKKQHHARFIRDFSFGKVYVNKSEQNEERKGYMHVRSNGVWMFSIYHGMPLSIYVEVDPAKSKQVFTSNRDGLQYDERKELDGFIQELGSETRSALERKNRKTIKVIDPTTGFRIYPKSMTAKALQIASESASGASYDASSVTTAQLTEMLKMVPIPASEYTTQHHDAMIRCSMSMNDSNDPKIAGLALKYDPEILQKTSTRYKLLKTWSILCQEVVGLLANLIQEEITYGIGWIFCDENEDRKDASCYKHNRFYLLLNPLDKEGKMRYSINRKSDLIEMLTLAIHEVSHIRVQSHNQDFAYTMTELTKRAFCKMSEIFRMLD